MTKPSVAIIIPACNEAASIGDCLRALLLQSLRGPIDVVVAVNGSADDTAEIASEFQVDFDACGRSLEILELPRASKTDALNAGDAHVDADIRIYLDADAVLSPNAVETLAIALAGPQPRLASPRLRAKSVSASTCAAVWSQLPPISDDVAGGGCYAMSRSGRARFGTFPDVIADDGFVRAHFARSERLLLATANYTVRFPGDATIGEVWARWLQGNAELTKLGFVTDDPGLRLRRLCALLRAPGLWTKLPAFLRMRAKARRMARDRFLSGDRSWPRAGDRAAL